MNKMKIGNAIILDAQNSKHGYQYSIEFVCLLVRLFNSNIIVFSLLVAR